VSLLDVLTSQLGGGTTERLASALGTDPAATSRAISAALPTLLGGLADNASRPGGAEALAAALDRHDGSTLSHLADPDGVTRIDTNDGDKILGHVLGERRGAVEASLANNSGLDLGSIAKLLPMLAPLVMGLLGQKKSSEGLGAEGLGSLLSGEKSGIAGTLGKLLDRDGDGNPLDDILGMVTGQGGGGGKGGAGGVLGNVLGGLFKGR